MSTGTVDVPVIAQWMLGPVTFAAPAMLWGAVAALGPVLIHLMMRSKPQRVPLPTLQFVLKTHQQTQARHRLKQLLLLLLRMLAILLLVLMLARPTLESAALPVATRKPVEAVFCMDDSASMDYRSQNVSRFEQARELAVRLLRDQQRFPPGSRLTMLTGSAPMGSARLSPDIPYIRSQVEQLEVGQHDRPVGPMLERAYELLGEGSLDTREIYVFNDLTRQSWRDTPTGAFAGRNQVRVFCVDVGVETNANFALLDPAVPERPVPVGTPVQIRFGIQAGQSAGRRDAEVLIDAKPRWRLDGLTFQPRQVGSQVVRLVDLAPGLHQGEIRIYPEDPLDIDNVRYFSVYVGRPPTVAVVAGADSEVAAVVSAMLAPADLPADRRRIGLTQVAGGELAGLKNAPPYSAILLVDVPSISPSAFAGLADYVTAGGWLIVVPGPAMNPAGYQAGQSVLAALPVEVVAPLEPVYIAPPDRPHALLGRFQDGTGLSLSEPAVRRYVRFGAPLGGGSVIARLSDGSPAIVVRRVGRGTSVVLAISPQRDWGDWAVDAGPLLVLLNTLVAESLPQTTPASNLRIGQEARLFVRGSAASSQAASIRAMTITSPTRRQSWPAVVEATVDTVAAITDRCGHYRIVADGGTRADELGYSVNTPADESQLDRLSPSDIESRFAPGTIEVMREPDALTGGRMAGGTSRDLSVWLALTLLGLLIAESFLSNRFYRQPETERP